MLIENSRIDDLLEDIEEILAKRYDAANDDTPKNRISSISESDILRQIRIRVARFRQGY